MHDTRPSLLFAPDCCVCGQRAVTLEVVAPGELPQEWNEWDPRDQHVFRKWRKPETYTVFYQGIVAGSGPSGTPATEEEAREIVRAILPVLRIDAIQERWYDNLGYCTECGAFYCHTHWSPDVGGFGRCPKGHGKSLDPLWSPDDYDDATATSTSDGGESEPSARRNADDRGSAAAIAPDAPEAQRRQEAYADRLLMLRALVYWRDLTDADLDHAGMDGYCPLNDGDTFPRNALGRLFDYYYAQGDDSEIAHFGVLLQDYLRKGSYFCEFFGRQSQKLVAWLVSRGEPAQARSLLESCLRSMGVLEGDGDSARVGGFGASDYSYSWPVIHFESYAKLLVAQGEADRAVRLIEQALQAGVRDDTTIMLRRVLATANDEPLEHRYDEMRVERTALGLGPTDSSIERAALDHLCGRLKKQGMVAHAALWRALPELMSPDLGEADLAARFEEIASEAPPEGLRVFLRASGERLLRGVEATVGATSGAVGFPDLILWDEGGGGLVLVQVKNADNELMPHQEAVMNRLMEAGIHCGVLRITR